ncbi:ABC transporter permease [Ectothiorhodospira marina]|uniref:NitT/TauT family transport system permease protein n=1 Tax=Ectothiorhodospira marina TaxID=1396821 RepID=A0A1H7M9I6_9GAMM|nr:ABC transporter permease subunit [Ectothiorhodospira marina]SEL07843.1 NitT/TauT family transport system permease protein [Ectothiorhodospira marina]
MSLSFSWRRLAPPAAGLAGLLLLWSLASLQLPAAILPTPWAVTDRLVTLLGDGALWVDSAVTLRNVLLAFFLSLLGGVLLGLGVGRWPALGRALHPVVVVVEAAPHIAWLVLAVLWLGIGSGPPVLVGVSMALPLVYMATAHGISQVDQGLLDMAHVYRLSRWTRVWYIFLPHLALTLTGAASSALSVAWRSVIMAEAFSSDAGLGQSLWGGYLYGAIDDVYATILWIVLLGLALEYLLIDPVRHRIERRLRHE